MKHCQPSVLKPSPQRMPRDARNLSGILLLDKPAGMSSNQALQRVRHLYRADKAGHTGSLDPLATGLLPVCFGEATKIAGLLLGSRKAYETECLLGETTTTDDAEGEVVARRAVPDLDEAAICAELVKLTGTIVQIPPIYSALKQAGVPLYRRARRGEAVEAPPRQVDVHHFQLIENSGHCLRLHVECGSGTYVRSLVRDLGEQLGCGAHVTALRRLWVAPFRAPRMYCLDQLGALAETGLHALDQCLLPLEQGLADYPAVHVDVAAAQRLRQGQTVDVAVAVAAGRCVALDASGAAIALADCDGEGKLCALRGFNPRIDA